MIMFNYNEVDPQSLEFVEIAKTSELPPGERLFVELGSKPIVLFNIAGTLFAIGDVCTHDNGPLGDGEVDGHEVICPRHGARFDIRSGKTMGLPAVVDIPAYPVRVREEKIEIGIPKTE
jgi:3-phenylpropionate/trans-cinnamate dioxygenase ferredoxin component